VLARGKVLLCQRRIARKVSLRVGQRRFVLSFLGVRGVEIGLIGGRINLGEQLARLHDLAFAEENLFDRAINTCLHRYGVECSHRAEAGANHRKAGVAGHGCRYRDWGGRACWLRCARCGLVLAEVIIAACAGSQAKHNKASNCSPHKSLFRFARNRAP
jgi:hypothetical protein